jgi:helicase MOV-10
VTRAQALLIIVGDPSVLSLDPLWRSFLNYIHVNHGWRGDEPTWNTHDPVRQDGGYDAEARDAGMHDMNALMRRMESLTLEGMNGGGGDVADDDDSGSEDNADRPWRETE